MRWSAGRRPDPGPLARAGSGADAEEVAHHRFPDHYATLGVPPAVSAAEIDRAYRARIRRVHPDLGTDPTDRARRTALAARLNAAAGVLRDPARPSWPA